MEWGDSSADTRVPTDETYFLFISEINDSGLIYAIAEGFPDLMDNESVIVNY